MNRPDARAPEKRELDGDPDLQVLITAAEAFPHFETLMMNAREEVQAGFRIFDPETRLRSEAARAIGETWYDLVVHTLRRGVRMTVVLSDFDPIHATDLHRAARRCLHQLRRAAVTSGKPGNLIVRAAPHPAQTGMPLRAALARIERKLLLPHVEKLNEWDTETRRRWMRQTPGVTMLLARAAEKISPRPWRPPHMLPGTHHQKLAVFDRERLYIGGLDLDERRYDDPGHRRGGPDTWHDVQLSMRGTVASVAADHVEAFEAECAARQAPAPRPGLMRTLSVRRHPLSLRLGPKPKVHEIRDRLLAEIAQARQFIYIETQFLRDPTIAKALARRGREVPGLSLVAVLPAAPEDKAFDGNRGMDARFGEYLQSRAVRKISEAMGTRAVFVAPAQPKPDRDREDDPNLDGAPLVYVHAKVAVFDDRVAIVGSANLNGRSMLWDTEVAVALETPGVARDLRLDLMRHWMADNGTEAHYDPETAAEAWGRTARKNAGARPKDRDCFVLPYPETSARAFGKWLPLFLHPMV